MDIVSGIIVFLMTWWVVFFMALPFGSKATTNPEQGHDTGAPQITYLKPKLLITTLITAALWLIVDYLISINLIDFRALGHAL